MAELLNLSSDSSRQDWENTLSNFATKYASKADFVSQDFTLDQKEQVIKMIVKKFITCDKPVRDTITMFALSVLRLLLRKVSSEFASSSTTHLVESMTYLCNFKDAESGVDPKFINEAYKCFVNVLHYDERLRIHFCKILDQDEMKSVQDVIKSETFQPLIARILFYSIHNEECAHTLYKRYPEIFSSFLDNFFNHASECDLKEPLIEVYICDSLKLFFTLISHVDVNVLFNEKKTVDLHVKHTNIFGSDVQHHTLQLLMLAPPEFIAKFFIVKDEIDIPLLTSIVQEFYSWIGVEETYQMVLMPILFILKKACANDQIRSLLFQALVEENWGEVKLIINQDYFVNRDKDMKQSEAELAEMRKAEIERKKSKQEEFGEDEPEIPEEGMTEEEEVQQKKMFDPQSDKKTHLAVLIHQMTHNNQEFKHAIAEFIYSLCEENVDIFNSVCGIGITAGFLAERGLLSQLSGIAGNM